MDPKEMESRFTYHAPKPGLPEVYTQVREFAKSFAKLVDNMCPDCREKSLAFTKIEEAVMWCNAGIARNR